MGRPSAHRGTRRAARRSSASTRSWSCETGECDGLSRIELDPDDLVSEVYEAEQLPVVNLVAAGSGPSPATWRRYPRPRCNLALGIRPPTRTVGRRAARRGCACGEDRIGVGTVEGDDGQRVGDRGRFLLLAASPLTRMLTLLRVVTTQGNAVETLKNSQITCMICRRDSSNVRAETGMSSVARWVTRSSRGVVMAASCRATGTSRPKASITSRSLPEKGSPLRRATSASPPGTSRAKRWRRCATARSRWLRPAARARLRPRPRGAPGRGGRAGHARRGRWRRRIAPRRAVTPRARIFARPGRTTRDGMAQRRQEIDHCVLFGHGLTIEHRTCRETRGRDATEGRRRVPPPEGGVGCVPWEAGHA